MLRMKVAAFALLAGCLFAFPCLAEFSHDIGVIAREAQRSGRQIQGQESHRLAFRSEPGELLISAETLTFPAEIRILSPEGETLTRLESRKTARVRLTSPDSHVLHIRNLSETPGAYAVSLRRAPAGEAGGGGAGHPARGPLFYLLMGGGVLLVVLAARKYSWRRLLANGALTLFGLVIALAVGETMLRLFPIPLTDYQERLRIMPDTHLGYRYAPDAIFAHRRDPCLNVAPITTNSLGFRDKEWTNKDRGGIAILGDSKMAALEVADGDHTADILEKLTGEKVLNFAMSGFGPFAELETYRRYVRPFKPRVVLLYFLMTNDISDSSAAMMHWETGRIYQPTGYVAGEAARVTPPIDLPHSMEVYRPSLKEKVLRSCHLCRVFLNIAPAEAQDHPGNMPVAKYSPELRNYIESRGAELNALYRNQRRNYKLDAFRDAKARVWREAWAAAEQAVTDLAREVRADGGSLVLIAVPQPQHDAQAARRRLGGLAHRLGIYFLDANDAFVNVSRRYDELKKGPDFSFSCDGHFNPFGHVWMATETARFLAGASLLSGDRPGLNARIEKLQSLSPMEVLGEEAHRQIYKKGTYTGRSNVKALLGN